MPHFSRAPARFLSALCAVPQAAWRVPGQYLVILRPGAHESHVQRTIRRLRAKAARGGHLLEVLQTYSGALRGFLVKMSSDVLHLVIASPVSSHLLLLCTSVKPEGVKKGVGQCEDTN